VGFGLIRKEAEG